MRIVIETDEKSTAAAMPIVGAPDQTAVLDGGQPAASLLQAIGATRGSTAESGVEGTDAGGPPSALLQALQKVSGTDSSVDYSGGGAAR